jgi:hypothetical protein
MNENGNKYAIAALRERRAAIDGELRQLEKRMIQLSADLDSVDGALRVLDPSIVAHAIRPKFKREAPTRFRHGQFSRAVLAALRKATAPMTPREIAAKVARDVGADVSTTEAMNVFVAKTRKVLTARRGDLASERRGDVIVWRVTEV